MTECGHDVQGGGISPPFKDYIAAVTKCFLNAMHKSTIESSIATRRKLDCLHGNSDGSGNEITDSYIEFRIPGVPVQFLDLLTLTLDTIIYIKTRDGTRLGNTDYAVFASGVSNTLFKSYTCYFNEHTVGTNPLYN